MQYYSKDSGIYYTPVIGASPQERHTFMPTAPFMSPGFTAHPGYFGEYPVPTPNQYAAYSPNNLSRQSTILNQRMNTSGSKPFCQGVTSFGSPKPTILFRRRNSTNPVKSNGKPKAFGRTHSSATNNSRVFVPKVYTTDVYPVKFPVQAKGKQNDVKLAFGTPFSNASTIVSRNNTLNRHYSDLSGYGSEVSYAMRPRASRRNPNFVKSSPLDKAFRSFKRDFELPKVDPKDAVEFIEGLVLAALGIVRAILKELRADIIAGMFISDDPDYDAARSYYYTSNGQDYRHSGFTERIDYIQAIENEKKTVLAEKKESVRIETMREYSSFRNKDFMDMTEREFEEFLLRQAYPNAPQFVS
ncbi:conserved hypothetical protein [Theileria orientalis strain Shintoku]|uniref:Uncharacterized protein n=1 Tax=Theileria orientalis strain Shintoku TaxID=869250 RepID=J4DP63_THEOR|nr:conserved hypothetical protein [Theileria orientalis strain Shintoku]PVC51845.1 hypothetical protein MACL_00001246 [Theileria orientalis]BAM40159.1 conserved hypothetical protein [Theileria orientalis strain Shintoku]|eukprot:XP_009690460.1 conserved hypothetical protein [Theileria orientalis strain Shintoku]